MNQEGQQQLNFNNQQDQRNNLFQVNNQIQPVQQVNNQVMAQALPFNVLRQLLTLRRLKFKIIFLTIVIIRILMNIYFKQNVQQNVYAFDICRINVKNPKQQEIKDSLYSYDQQIQSMINHEQLNQFFLSQQSHQHTYDKNKIIQKIKMIQLTHSINFKGEIELQISKYNKNYQNCSSNQVQALYQKYQRFQNMVETQKSDLNQKYNISQYKNAQLSFCIVVSSYNNAHNHLYFQNLDSIFMQDYNNYHVVYLDNASTDETGKKVNKYIQKYNIPKNKIQVIINSQNLNTLKNIYQGIHSHCTQGEIITIIDGHNSFIGRYVLSMFNSIYRQKNVGMVYSSSIKIQNSKSWLNFFSKSKKEILFPITSKRIFENNEQKQAIIKGQIFKINNYNSFNLQTFYFDVFNKMKKEDFQYKNGSFFEIDYNKFIYNSMVELLRQKIYYAQQITYEYRFDACINNKYEKELNIENQSSNIYPSYQALTEEEFQILKSKKLKYYIYNQQIKYQSINLKYIEQYFKENSKK